MSIKLEKVKVEDLEVLVNIKKKSFKKEFDRLGFTPEEMISFDWHKNMSENSIYFKIIENNVVIGGVNIFTENNEGYLCSLFIIEELQNKGIGQDTIRQLEEKHSNVNKWTLETPSSSIQNKIFYEKCGYKIIDEIIPDGAPEGFSLYQFMKTK